MDNQKENFHRMMTSRDWTKDTKDDDVNDVHDVHNEKAAAAAKTTTTRGDAERADAKTSEKAWKCCEEMHPKKRWGIRDGAGTVSGTREASEEDVGKCEGKSDGNGVQRWYMCRG